MRAIRKVLQHRGFSSAQVDFVKAREEVFAVYVTRRNSNYVEAIKSRTALISTSRLLEAVFAALKRE
jgi:hypothetical protein